MARRVPKAVGQIGVSKVSPYKNTLQANTWRHWRANIWPSSRTTKTSYGLSNSSSKGLLRTSCIRISNNISANPNALVSITLRPSIAILVNNHGLQIHFTNITQQWYHKLIWETMLKRTKSSNEEILHLYAQTYELQWLYIILFMHH